MPEQFSFLPECRVPKVTLPVASSRPAKNLAASLDVDSDGGKGVIVHQTALSMPLKELMIIS